MIIGISGKISSGKDTVGKIIQYFTCVPKSADDLEHMKKFIIDDRYKDNLEIVSSFKVKKFADKLKDMVCILLDSTREQLEDRDFKDKELGEEWWTYTDGIEMTSYINGNTKLLDVYNTRIQKTTPRLLLQLLGTQCGRNIIHPNIWVNALMSEYKSCEGKSCECKEACEYPEEEPNWVITDMRFANELKAVEDREGISIRVNRDNGTRAINVNPHESETSLDSATFDYMIENDSDIESLIEKVRIILKKEQLI